MVAAEAQVNQPEEMGKSEWDRVAEILRMIIGTRSLTLIVRKIRTFTLSLSLCLYIVITITPSQHRNGAADALQQQAHEQHLGSVQRKLGTQLQVTAVCRCGIGGDPGGPAAASPDNTAHTEVSLLPIAH